MIDWYTLLVGAASFVALVVHGNLWVVMPNDAVILTRRIPPKITLGYYNCIIRRARNHDQAGAV